MPPLNLTPEEAVTLATALVAMPVAAVGPAALGRRPVVMAADPRDTARYLFADAEEVGWAIASDTSLSGVAKPETYWIVEDLAALEQSLAGKVKITHPMEKRPFCQVLGIEDPAGETLYLVEFAKERPSKDVKEKDTNPSVALRLW